MDDEGTFGAIRPAVSIHRTQTQSVSQDQMQALVLTTAHLLCTSNKSSLTNQLQRRR